MKRKGYFCLLWILMSGFIVSCGFFQEIWDPSDVSKVIQDNTDKVPPEVTITSPTNGHEVGATYQMTGTVSDVGSGVETVYVSVDGKIWKFAELSGNTWTATLTLSEYGNCTNFVYAEDKANNSSTTQAVWVNHLEGIPSIAIVSPPSGTITNMVNITLSGTASGDSMYSVTQIQVQINGGAWTNATGTLSWTQDIVLTANTNIIYARAIADSGRTNTSPAWIIIYEKAVYVSPTGSDGNPGTNIAYPLRSLPVAIALAQTSGITNIRVESGSYVPGAGLSATTNGCMITNITDLNIFGGYNSAFSERTGISILDGDNSLYHIMWIKGATNVTIDRLALTKGWADGSGDHDYGGGLFVRDSEGIKITNCLITNNYAVIGGGVYFDNGAGHVLYSAVSGNTAYYDGGGVYIEDGSNCTLSGIVSGNSATNGYAGGIYVNRGYNHILSGTVSGNTAYDGGGVYIAEGYSHTLSGTISGNIATNGYGGGVLISSSGNCILNGTIYGNTAYQGGGVYFTEGEVCSGHELSGVISNNTADYGGGVFIYRCEGFAVGGIISSNSAIYGGGIYLDNTWSEHTFTATIKANSQYGIYKNGTCTPDLFLVIWGSGAETNTPANEGP